MWVSIIWGNFFNNRYFANNCLIKVWEFFCTRGTHIIVIIFRTVNFVSIKSIFSYLQIFLPNFALFRAKSPSVTQRSPSPDNGFKKSKHSTPFSLKLMAQIIFHSYWKQFEFKVTITIRSMQNASRILMWPSFFFYFWLYK